MNNDPKVNRAVIDKLRDLRNRATQQPRTYKTLFDEAMDVAAEQHKRAMIAECGNDQAEKTNADLVALAEKYRRGAYEEAALIVERHSLPTIQTPSMWLVDKASIAADIRSLAKPD